MVKELLPWATTGAGNVPAVITQANRARARHTTRKLNVTSNSLRPMADNASREQALSG